MTLLQSVHHINLLSPEYLQTGMFYENTASLKLGSGHSGEGSKSRHALQPGACGLKCDTFAVTRPQDEIRPSEAGIQKKYRQPDLTGSDLALFKMRTPPEL